MGVIVLHMFESRLSRLLMLLGAAVGVGSLVIWALEMRINFPDWLVRLAMVKLALAGSLGLLAGGALLGRHAKSRQLSTNPSPALGEAVPEFVPESREGRARVEVDSDDEAR